MTGSKLTSKFVLPDGQGPHHGEVGQVGVVGHRQTDVLHLHLDKVNRFRTYSLILKIYS